MDGAYTHLDCPHTQMDGAYTHLDCSHTQMDLLNTQPVGSMMK
jgi:hypothetical protein